MKNPTLKGFEGTPKDFTKILYEGWWNHRRKIIRKLEGEMYCNILETIQPPEIRERLLNPSLDIDDPTFNFGNLQLKGFRGKKVRDMKLYVMIITGIEHSGFLIENSLECVVNLYFVCLRTQKA